MRFSAALVSAALLSACHSNNEPNGRNPADAAVLATADFEQSIGWGDADPASLTTEKAHSGQWSVRVKPEAAFGYTYARQLKDLSPTPLTRLLLEGQVLRAAPGSTAKLVVQVDASPTDETKVFYAALPLEQSVPKIGEWTAVSLPITLPTSATGTNRIKIYLWNDQGTAPTYLDDLTLRKAN
ncbi:hypothetical protein JAO73_00385 [Hymenobacter sp. BT523]|uniref:hypothetical protein n=1 Tax=Hymenobacter sp. BT523 TaxID=2795725 RepID=UPI0018ED2624|nr:hypothetical protein [Hymenobacter sp. BT523]MBJ6107448.1 hypothetical protein [Hymenobacter sp. BT523]